MTNITRDGVNIYYDIQGEGEPLVLLMGLGAHGLKWEPHLKEYRKHFKCIVIDNRGAGQSDKPEMEAYTTEMMAEDTISVLEALKIEKAHFHGISMGGAISQMIAVKYPERVKSLVLTSTFSSVDHFFKRALEILRDSVGLLDGATFGHLCDYMIYAAKYHETNMEDILEGEAQEDPYPMPAYAYRAQCNACITHNALPLLKSIKAPALVAAGDSDLFISAETTKTLVEGIQGARLYLCKDGGHVHHWEKLDAFNRETLAFLLSNTSN